MRIGILTFHRALNCGAMLQAWALKSVLEKEGHQVCFIKNHVGEQSRWFAVPSAKSIAGRVKGLVIAGLKNLCSIGCMNKMLTRCNAFRATHLAEGSLLDCDVLVVGSDQVWRIELTKSERNLFLGDSVPAEIPMVAYAASVGDSRLSLEDKRELVDKLQRYASLSVREDNVRLQLMEDVGRDIRVVADPTLLLDAEEYARIADDTVQPSAPYLFAYAVHATPFFAKTAKALARQLGLKLIMTSACQNTRYQAQVGLTYGVSPERMIGYLRGAKCVIASSFHGTALSLLNQKPFVSLRERRDENPSRPAELLIKVGESRRLCTPETSLTQMRSLLTTPLNGGVRNVLLKLRRDSLSWLHSSLMSAGGGGR